MTDEATRSPHDQPLEEADNFEKILARIAEAPEVPLGSTLSVGVEVGGFHVCERIGRGGFGSVYRATHPRIGKEVAIKVLSRAHKGDVEMVRRFVEEARAVSRLHHPNIVDIFGFGELQDGTPYYVMELLRGKPLSTLLDEGERLPLDRALTILGQVASALDAAHAAGILHRDLKPPNVFVMGDITGDFKVKLLDFGIAKFLDGSTETTAAGMMIGTPAYMSPEQCAADTLAATSDVYALGVMSFELFTGRLPFSSDSNARVLVQHLVDAPPRMSDVASHLPPELDAPVAAMLEKEPAKRPQSACAAVEGLRRALLELPDGSEHSAPSTRRRGAAAQGSAPSEASQGSATHWSLQSRAMRWSLAFALVALCAAGAAWMRSAVAPAAAVSAEPLSGLQAAAPQPTQVLRLQPSAGLGGSAIGTDVLGPVADEAASPTPPEPKPREVVVEDTASAEAPKPKKRSASAASKKIKRRQELEF